MTSDRKDAEPKSSVDLLEQRLGADWGQIRAARSRARNKRNELRKALSGIDSEDTSIVVSGSLGRDEFTDGSDIDWTFLIDGQADPQHVEVVNKIDQVMLELSKKPHGAEGTFGGMVFSHDLIHQIGGEDDTNTNTTRRILLLLESDFVGRPEAFDRVVTSVLRRYLTEDEAFIQGLTRHHVPRFLLNDFARYWRTMAVDFAYKRRARLGKGAAMRNIKLRMSRKLIFVSGLLTCFSCELGLGNSGGFKNCNRPEASACVHCLQRFTRRTPLEILASTLCSFEGLDDLAKQLFDSYDGFLGLLAEPETRNRLEKLPPDHYRDDEVYQRARVLTHAFRDGLQSLFFDRKPLAELTRFYGVF